jgi:uncharacterized membrane protein YgdD (TMEM256/DUF423 family)
MKNTTSLRLGAAFAFTAVALGAFGAHALHERLAAAGRAGIWETAVFYHFVHALGILIVSSWEPLPRWGVRCFALGIAIFSGSLYLLAVTGFKPLGAITPLGGVAFLAGWLLIALRKSGT